MFSLDSIFFDPFALLELCALVLTTVYIGKLTFGPSLSSRSSYQLVPQRVSRQLSFVDGELYRPMAITLPPSKSDLEQRVCPLVEVGISVSTPKKSLRRQKVHR